MSDNTIPWTGTSQDFDQLWIKEGGNVVEDVPDLLSTMFEQQRRHMRAYDAIQGTPTPTADYPQLGLGAPEVQAKIREFASYTVEELYEAINGLKNKPWKQTYVPADRQMFEEELADAWHFFIELHIIAGVSAEDVFRRYFAKTLVNVERRETGY